MNPVFATTAASPFSNLDTLKQRNWDVVVIGAGPAGGVAAYELARQGTAVLLVEKAAFPRAKVCGSCFNGSALGTLDLIGLGHLARQLGAVPLRTFRLAAGARRTELALPQGAALSRSRFDAALVEAAQLAGATFIHRTRAEVATVNSSSGRVVLHGSGSTVEVSARVVLVADGLAGQSLKSEARLETGIEASSWIGAGTTVQVAAAFYEPGTVFMACGAGGYVGAVRLEDGQLNVAAALDPRNLRGRADIRVAVERLLHDAGWPPLPALPQATWRGTPALTRNASRVAFDRVLLLGDRAGYVEPFTGEGIAWALASGVAAARLANQSLHECHFDLECAWTTRYHEMLDQRCNVCKRLTQILRFPKLVRTALVALALMPGLATPFVRQLNISPLQALPNPSPLNWRKSE
jgi:flavin-dependent dehydrogenase